MLRPSLRMKKKNESTPPPPWASAWTLKKGFCAYAISCLFHIYIVWYWVGVLECVRGQGETGLVVIWRVYAGLKKNTSGLPQIMTSLNNVTYHRHQFFAQ